MMRTLPSYMILFLMVEPWHYKESEYRIKPRFGSFSVSKLSLSFVNRCNYRLFSLSLMKADYV